jgi:hypothetical protein
MSRIALNQTLKVRAAIPTVQHALRHASSSTSGNPTPPPSPLASTSSTPRSEIPDTTINARKSRTTHFGFREIPEEDKETMGMSTLGKEPECLLINSWIGIQLSSFQLRCNERYDVTWYSSIMER